MLNEKQKPEIKTNNINIELFIFLKNNSLLSFLILLFNKIRSIFLFLKYFYL